jgi:hypothetical protein
MGNCISYDFLLTGNKGEDFIRDIIRNFKIREYFINDLKKELFEIKEPCERNSFYQNYLIDENEKSNKYIKFQYALLDLTNFTDKYDNDEFMILKLFSLAANSNDKIYFLKKNFPVENFEEFISLCKIIWRINLIENNNIILNIIDSDNPLKKDLEFLIKNIYNENNYKEFIKGIRDQWLMNIDKNEENNLSIVDHFWEDISNKYDFCFNCLELRHYFFLKFEK